MKRHLTRFHCFGKKDRDSFSFYSRFVKSLLSQYCLCLSFSSFLPISCFLFLLVCHHVLQEVPHLLRIAEQFVGRRSVPYLDDIVHADEAHFAFYLGIFQVATRDEHPSAAVQCDVLGIGCEETQYLSLPAVERTGSGPNGVDLCFPHFLGVEDKALHEEITAQHQPLLIFTPHHFAEDAGQKDTTFFVRLCVYVAGESHSLFYLS